MGNERFKTAAPSPSSWPDESSSIEHGVQSRPLQSPRKPWRKKSAAATSRRTVIETAGIDDDEEVVGEESSEYNPRSFPYHIKQACWEKAEKIKGRDPDRWRRDPLGNVVFRKLVGCSGCLCHDYDHIHPYSKGGKSTVENCQVLQGAANRAKSNHTHISTADLIQKSAYCRVSGREMDFLELSAYGNVHRGQESGGCRIQ